MNITNIQASDSEAKKQNRQNYKQNRQNFSNSNRLTV